MRKQVIDSPAAGYWVPAFTTDVFWLIERQNSIRLRCPVAVLFYYSSLG